MAGILKTHAQAQQPSTLQDQQAPQQQQIPQSPAPSGQQLPAAAGASQSQLPQIVVSAPKTKPKPTAVARPQPSAPPNPTAAAQAVLDAKMQKFDQARDVNLLPKIGASTYTISRDTIEKLPQVDNTPIDKVILQLPGVSYDSAVANPDFHVRNEYGNVQTRINGVVRPRGRIRPRAVPRHQLHRQHVAFDRRAAGRIRSAHRRRARHHQPKLCCAGRRSQPLWRQPADVHAELRLWRQRRQLGVFCLGARHLERSRHRKSDARAQRHSRPDPARQVLRLCLDAARRVRRGSA